MNRDEWLRARRSGIGGSDIAAIVGLSPWRTPMDVYLDKRGEIDDVVDEKSSEAMYWGTVLEDIVAHEYGRRTGRKVQRINTMLQHPTLKWALANIDRAVINPEVAGNVRWKDGRLTTDRIVECKTANGFAAGAWGEPGTDQVPEYYIPQPQWYMGITGASYCDVPVLIGGSDFRIYTIERDDELIADLFAAGEAFWQRIIDGIAPEPQTEQDARRLWQSHMPGVEKIVDVTIAEAVAELAAIKEQIGSDKKEGSLEFRAARLRDTICCAFGSAEAITYMGTRLATWKANKSSDRLDWESVARELGDVAGVDACERALRNHTHTTTGARILRLTKTKE